MFIQTVKNNLTHFRFYARFDSNLRKLVKTSNARGKEPPIEYMNSSESDKVSRLLGGKGGNAPQHRLAMASVMSKHRQAVSAYTESAADGGRTSLLVFDSTTGKADLSKLFSSAAWRDGTIASIVSIPTFQSWSKLASDKANAKILTFLIGTQGLTRSCADFSLSNLEHLQDFIPDLQALHRSHLNGTLEAKLKNETSDGFIRWISPRVTQTNNLSPLAEQNPNLLAGLLVHSEIRPILEQQVERYKLSDVPVTADGKSLLQRFDSIEPPSSSIYNERLARLGRRPQSHVV